MPDHMTREQRSRAMKRVKLKDGPLELLVRRELRKAGLRFHRNYKSLAGSPDIVFLRRKVAIFVDGDFWHGWRLPAWEYKLSEFWRAKLRANRKRDQRNFRRLRAANWTVIRLWGHEILSNTDRCIDCIIRALTESRLDHPMHKNSRQLAGPSSIRSRLDSSQPVAFATYIRPA